MLNYKQQNAVLRGPGYEAKVMYWMPFYGNMGLHDASWRSSFGGEIYKTRGTHGCVNAPLYLAETIYKNIEEGTPVICYEEPQ
jgi:lipoprotein-anchoring transpeptidase ErfK/SrfK